MRYPWTETKPGGSFFVASLHPAKTREMGLKNALQHHILAKGVPGILKGKHGVLFTRAKR